ncbi:MAG: histidine--tRNA ligase [Nitrospinota bacterium]
MPIKAVKGVKDLLPETAQAKYRVESVARDVFARFGFKEIVLPIFEKSELFIKSVGELTDIVQKEMYSFTDRGGESLTLRPEGTASCVRAYIEHSMYHPQGSVSKLFYFGPMFRQERPQAGRFRQFYQIGAELFGAASPQADAEVIHLLWLYINSVNVKGPRLSINSIGCSVCRPPFKKALVEFLKAKHDSLCELCRQRYEKNPLRVFDCKNEQCKELIKDAPTIDGHWCGGCTEHQQKLRDSLDALKILYTVNPRMVRGLDYYTRTVFEVTAEGLGAKSEIAGGGRYDDLVKNSGGPQVPAIGFAIGLERLMESVDGKENFTQDKPDVYMVYMGEEAAAKGFFIAGRLRAKGIKAESPYTPGKMKTQMGKAGKSGAKLAVIIGENELANGVAIVKNLAEEKQSEFPLDSLAAMIEDKLS